MKVFLLSILNKCNLNCGHCRSEKSNLILSINQIEEIIQRIKGEEINVNLTGGEPLLHPDIEKIIKLFKTNRIKLSLSTNGTFLTKEKAENLKKAGLDAINISLDSILEEYHNKIRNSKTSFKEALKAINISVKSGLNTRIASVYSKENIKNVFEIVNFAINAGCSGVSFRKILPVGAANELFLVSKEEDISFLIKAYTCLSLLYPYFNIFIEHPLDKYIVSQLFNKKIEGSGCGAFNTIFEIKANGDVFPCPALQISVGNIFKDDFSKIKSNQKNLISMDKLKGNCEVCKIKQSCGGCRALAYHAFKNPNEEDPFCIVYDLPKILANIPLLKETNKLSEKEIESIINLTEKNMKNHLEKSGIKWDKEILLSDLKKDFNFWVLYKDKNIVGYVWLFNGDELHLKSIILTEEIRRKGIGSLLLGRIDRYAGKKPVLAFVQKSNISSQNFFESNGYKKIGAEKFGFVYRKESQ